MNEAFFEKILSKSMIFWTRLFILLDNEKKEPLRDNKYIQIGLTDDKNYILKMDKNHAWIQRTEPNGRCVVNRQGGDSFPYTKLLDYFLKETVVKESASMSETIRWLKATRKVASWYYSVKDTEEYKELGLPNRVRIKAECLDGFQISIQAGDGLYCSPRVNLDSCDYETVELGYPSTAEDLIMPYGDFEPKDDPTRNVYAYVPIDVVDEVLAKHGGIVNWKEAYAWQKEVI